MANPNPSPATRFGVNGHTGTGRAKQKGARDRMSAAFLTALADDFDEYGKDVIARVREEDPSTYMRVFASMCPKELEITRPLDGLNTEQLEAAIQALTDAIRAKAPELETEQPPTMVN